jgi:uncharacterized protein YcbX
VILTSLCVYPVKSCGGIPVESWTVDERGLAHDRRWMLVDEHGQFMTQRRWPRMALVRPGVSGDSLVLEAPNMPALELPLRPVGSGGTLVSVWGDTVEALEMGDEPARWFGEFLGARCRLVYQPDDSVRSVDPDYAATRDQVGFADGFSFLVISSASLDHLNARLAEPVPMDRFRPSLVVGGCEPHAEDGWSRVRAGSIDFRVIKPCARCSIPLVDQETTARGKEPLRTLAGYRNFGGKILFGQNLAHDGTGMLNVGDRVEILS